MSVVEFHHFMSIHAQRIETIHLPRPTGYAQAYAAMCARRDAVIAGTAPNTLFVVEHTPVITLGRNFKAQHLLLSETELTARGIELVRADRGGDATYHGPGQLVAYPVLNLQAWRPSVRWYLRGLEEVIIRTLAGYGLEGERIEGLTGVWVNGAKVAAIGIGLRHWVSYHGVALNIDPEMEHFRVIVPCGISDKPVTSLRALLGTAPEFDEVSARFEREFRNFFQEA